MPTQELKCISSTKAINIMQSLTVEAVYAFVNATSLKNIILFDHIESTVSNKSIVDSTLQTRAQDIGSD